MLFFAINYKLQKWCNVVCIIGCIDILSVVLEAPQSFVFLIKHPL